MRFFQEEKETPVSEVNPELDAIVGDRSSLNGNREPSATNESLFEADLGVDDVEPSFDAIDQVEQIRSGVKLDSN